MNHTTPHAVSAPSTLRIGIAGAGVLGRLLAWRLARAGHRVTVFDPAPSAQPDYTQPRAAGWTAAGMLSPLAELECATHAVAELGWRSIDLWRAHVADLQAHDGQSVYFAQRGSLLLAHGSDMGAAQRLLGALQSKMPAPADRSNHQQRGARDMVGSGDGSPPPLAQALSASALAELEPGVSRHLRGWLLPGEGQIHTVQAMLALAQAASRYGARFVWGQAAGQVEPYAIDGQPFDWVFDVRGLGARQEVTDTATSTGTAAAPTSATQPGLPARAGTDSTQTMAVGAHAPDSAGSSGMGMAAQMLLYKLQQSYTLEKNGQHGRRGPHPGQGMGHGSGHGLLGHGAGCAALAGQAGAAASPGTTAVTGGTQDFVQHLPAGMALPPQPVRGVRGEVFTLHAPGVVLHRPVRLIHPRHRVYVVPRPGDLIVVGASEIESEDRSPVSLRSTVELLAAAHAVLPELTEARIIHSEVNLRPSLPDNLPAITITDGLVRINGLFRHGWLIAPALVEQALHDSGLLEV